MQESHKSRVEELLADAAAAHASLISQLAPELRASIPVDAQGITQAIDHLAVAAGLSPNDRRDLIRPHGANPAVLHAQVYGGAPLTQEMVLAAFVEGARVRAEAIGSLADLVGGEPLGREVRNMLVAYPPPVVADGEDTVAALRATYAAQEQAVIVIAQTLDVSDGL